MFHGPSSHGVLRQLLVNDEVHRAISGAMTHALPPDHDARSSCEPTADPASRSSSNGSPDWLTPSAPLLRTI